MRRVRIETGIYAAERASGSVFEIGYYDEDGKQRWRTVDGDLEDARKLRAKLHSGRGRNHRLRADLLRIAKASETITPSKRMLRDALIATREEPTRYRAWLTVAAIALAMARRYER